MSTVASHIEHDYVGVDRPLVDRFAPSGENHVNGDEGPPMSMPSPLDALDEQILEYLIMSADSMAMGLKLGYSRRSIQRRIGEIVKRLEARNRYHAVAIAVHEGWIEISERSGRSI